ncbi:hypothetical protein ACH3XW_48240 [Acanthocheilonema viteae]
MHDLIQLMHCVLQQRFSLIEDDNVRRVGFCSTLYQRRGTYPGHAQYKGNSSCIVIPKRIFRNAMELLLIMKTWNAFVITCRLVHQVVRINTF